MACFKDNEQSFHNKLLCYLQFLKNTNMSESFEITSNSSINQYYQQKQRWNDVLLLNFTLLSTMIHVSTKLLYDNTYSSLKIVCDL